MSTIEHLIATYGGLAIGLGAALEGEAVVTTGGYLAHRGLIHPVVAALCAFVGSFVADQFVFFMGRHHRERPLVQRARAKPAVARAVGFIERHPIGFCFAFRFIYGLRIAGPLAIGLSQVPARRFVLLNAASAAIWAATFTFIGFRFGGAFEAAVRRLLTANRGVLIAGAVVIVLALAVWQVRRRGEAARA